MLENIKVFIWLLRHGEKSHGCEYWEGKPKFDIDLLYYDGWHFVIHLGKFWFEIDS